jgi:hypothetical protein
MKAVRKFSSFEDLKSSEDKTADRKQRLKKHIEFEKVIKGIYSIIIYGKGAAASK